MTPTSCLGGNPTNHHKIGSPSLYKYLEKRESHMIVSLDISMRSTGIVILEETGRLESCCIVANKDILDEELLERNVEDVLEFLLPYKEQINHIVIEGLAFGAKCKRADMLFANYWFIRCFLRREFGDDVTYDIYPVTAWRKTFISKERAREVKLKKENKKGWQKGECVSLLSGDVRERFEKYIKENKVKKDGIYDLTDSFLMAKHHISEKISC